MVVALWNASGTYPYGRNKLNKILRSKLSLWTSMNKGFHVNTIWSRGFSTLLFWHDSHNIHNSKQFISSLTNMIIVNSLTRSSLRAKPSTSWELYPYELPHKNSSINNNNTIIMSYIMSNVWTMFILCNDNVEVNDVISETQVQVLLFNSAFKFISSLTISSVAQKSPYWFFL